MVDPLVIFLAKSLTMPKKTEMYVLVPPGIVCYAEKTFFGPDSCPNRYNFIVPQTFVELLVNFFWSLQVYRKKH